MSCARMSFRRGSIHLRDGLATISRLFKITGLFGRIKSLLQGSYAKETYNFKELTNPSHPTPSIHSHTLSALCLLSTNAHTHCCELEKITHRTVIGRLDEVLRTK